MDAEKVNKELKRVIGKGRSLEMPLHKTIEPTEIGHFDYCHFVQTDGQIFNLVTKNGHFSCPLKEVDWTILWECLGEIPIDEETEGILEPFEHFEVGTDREQIWHWFEWYFDISLGEAMDNRVIDG